MLATNDWASARTTLAGLVAARLAEARGLGDLAMRADNALRTAILKLTGNRLFRNPHVFRRAND